MNADYHEKKGGMKIMKLLYRVAVLTFVLNVVFVIYIFITPGKLNDAYQWYKNIRKVERKVTASSVRHLKQKVPKKNSEIVHSKIENEWKDFMNITEKIVKEHDLSQMKALRLRSISHSSTATRKSEKDPNYDKLILIYTGLHKSETWYDLPLNETKDYLKRKKCKISNCQVSYDKSLFSFADVLIFHERNLPSSDVMEILNKRRPKNQRWVFFTSESPLNSESGIIPYNGLFNWTMTYKVSSDIYLPYLQYRRLNKKDLKNLNRTKRNYAAERPYSTAWLVSNCKFGFRMEFAHLLETFTEVHVGGNCHDKFLKHLNCTRYCDLDALKDYKFFLSFENGICTDYVSEKYWRFLELGLVPVVLGGANYSDPRIAIPGSFIDASQFKSIAELGKYLNFLNNNDEEYNKYFDWKKKYKVWHPIEGDWPFESYFLCRICKLLSKKNLKQKSYKISEFWNAYQDCEVPEKKLTEKFLRGDYNWNSVLEQEEERKHLKQSLISRDFDEVIDEKQSYS